MGRMIGHAREQEGLYYLVDECDNGNDHICFISSFKFFIK